MAQTGETMRGMKRNGPFSMAEVSTLTGIPEARLWKLFELCPSWHWPNEDSDPEFTTEDVEYFRQMAETTVPDSEIGQQDAA